MSILIEDIERIKKKYNCGLMEAKEIYKEELAEKRLQTIEANIATIGDSLTAIVGTLDTIVSRLEKEKDNGN